jgi:hypothetical protein
LNSRTFLPIQLAVCGDIFASFFYSPWKSQISREYPHHPALVISILSTDSLDIVSQYHQDGAGYTAKAWRNAEIISKIEQLPVDTTLISNESAMVLFFTGRPAYDITELIDHAPQTITDRYGDDTNDHPQKEFHENGAALVLFYSIYSQLQELYGDQTQSLENLPVD